MGKHYAFYVLKVLDSVFALFF